jgi:hypothetical protein
MLKALILGVMIELLHPSIQLRSYVREPVEEAERRYESIAEDLAAIVSDQNEPPVFNGPAGREATAILLSAIAWHESAFRRDVDACKGARSKGDDGRSLGLLQVMAGPNHEGYSADEICSDRRLALRLGLHVLRRAKENCSKGGPRSWLQSYASGGCGTPSNATQGVCAAFERVGTKRLNGISCSSTGPVSLRATAGS